MLNNSTGCSSICQNLQLVINNCFAEGHRINIDLHGCIKPHKITSLMYNEAFIYEHCLSNVSKESRKICKTIHTVVIVLSCIQRFVLHKF